MWYTSDCSTRLTNTDIYTLRSGLSRMLPSERLSLLTWSAVSREHVRSWTCTHPNWLDLAYWLVNSLLLGKVVSARLHLSSWTWQSRNDLRTGVGKHFLRRVTLKTYLLPGEAYITFFYFSYNLRSKYKLLIILL